MTWILLVVYHNSVGGYFDANLGKECHVVLFVGIGFEFNLYFVSFWTGVKKKKNHCDISSEEVGLEGAVLTCSTFILFMNYGYVHVFLEEQSRVKAY